MGDANVLMSDKVVVENNLRDQLLLSFGTGESPEQYSFWGNSVRGYAQMNP